MPRSKNTWDRGRPKTVSEGSRSIVKCAVPTCGKQMRMDVLRRHYLTNHCVVKLRHANLTAQMYFFCHTKFKCTFFSIAEREGILGDHIPLIRM